MHYGPGKGDDYRPVDGPKFRENYEALYPRTNKQRHVKCKTCHGAGNVPNTSQVYGAPARVPCPNPVCDGGLVPEVL
jgi:hypothetical protein